MATTNKTTAKKPATNRQVTKATPKPVAEEVIVEKSEPKNIIAKDIDVNQYIPVINGFQGKLIYISSRTGERFVWDEFGGEQEMELKELKNAKNSSKDFFLNNYFMFNDEDAWVLDYLGVSNYYKNAISINDFENLFEKDVGDLKEIIKSMSEGQKRSLSYKARLAVQEGTIDSIKVIDMLEKYLGVELIER